MARLFRLARIPSLVTSAVLVLTSSGGAQTLPLRDGFAARVIASEVGAPWRVRGLAPGLAAGEIWFAIGANLYRATSQAPPQQVTISPGGGDIGFVARPRASGPLFYSDFANATLVQRDLGSGGENLRSLPANTFDLEATLSGELIVVANPRWPAPGAGSAVFLLPPGQTPREVIHLLGASGPLLVDRASGDLYCAVLTAGAPPPPGSVTILRFARSLVDAAIAAGGLLQISDAAVYTSGLDGAFDLAQDDRGALYVSDPTNGDVRRIAPGGVIDAVPLVARQGRAALDLAFVDGSTPSFDPWQPADGATLLCSSSDFSTAAVMFAVTAAPASVSSPQAPGAAPGPFHIDVDGLAAGSAAVLLFDFLPAVPRRAVAIHNGVALFCDLDFAIAPVVVPLAVDTAGHAALDLVNPGTVALDLTIAAVGSPARSSDPIAVSSSLALTLLP